MKGTMLFILVLALPGAQASHDWLGLDLCRTYPERMPPELDLALLPDSAGDEILLLGRYCTQCHFAPGPGQHTAEEWSEVVSRMDVLMKTTARFGGLVRKVEVPDQQELDALVAYLRTYALKPLPDPASTPDAYVELCGDCHAAPDPEAYPDADWSALLARMGEHRLVMNRASAVPVAEAEVWAFLGLADIPARPPDLVPPAISAGSSRWLALGPFLVLMLLGLLRWWYAARRRSA